LPATNAAAHRCSVWRRSSPRCPVALLRLEIELTRKGGEREVSTDREIADYQEVGLIFFLVVAAIALLIWLETTGAAVLERISSQRPPCSVVSCEAQAQPQPQPPQSKPQPRPHSLRTRPRPLARLVADECLPPGYWGHYSRRLREPPRRSSVECWRDRSMRGPCFD
jgi:hypothetical protein